MQENFPGILRQLYRLDQEEALAQERIFALSALLDEQYCFLRRLHDAQSTLEAILSRLCEAYVVYSSQREEGDDA